MRVLSGRLPMIAGVALMMVGLLAFGLSSPSVTLGEDEAGLPTDVEQPGGDTGAGAAPPASLPETGASGSAEPSISTGILLATLLTALGLTITGAGLIAARKRNA